MKASLSPDEWRRCAEFSQLGVIIRFLRTVSGDEVYLVSHRKLVSEVPLGGVWFLPSELAWMKRVPEQVDAICWCKQSFPGATVVSACRLEDHGLSHSEL